MTTDTINPIANEAFRTLVKLLQEQHRLAEWQEGDDFSIAVLEAPEVQVSIVLYPEQEYSISLEGKRVSIECEHHQRSWSLLADDLAGLITRWVERIQRSGE